MTHEPMIQPTGGRGFAAAVPHHRRRPCDAVRKLPTEHERRSRRDDPRDEENPS
jgi:hypothetical protein